MNEHKDIYAEILDIKELKASEATMRGLKKFLDKIAEETMPYFTPAAPILGIPVVIDNALPPDVIFIVSKDDKDD